MRMVLLQSIDSHWREHLAALDYLRQGIHLRGYAQKNPKQEYKREAFELFAQLLDVVKMEVTRVLMTVRIQTQEQVAQAAEAIEEQASAVGNVTYTHPNEDGSVSQEADPATLAQAACPRSGATTPAPAAAARSTSTATASWPDGANTRCRSVDRAAADQRAAANCAASACAWSAPHVEHARPSSTA